ncbi:4-hydroxyphenylpyruvate dioxygenase [Saccharopolyspora indica]|uniref:4-hydroxyphenylpyruvate dioxygenase n=1 Tax=Saccharopolyspora indica TaxID=1229659 RepID=UPI0022EB27AD|nr:4-hydroxyphenylpyruvate dioxygenase [Saccharopolyspora indica]MDA3647009.1 4-hydroxyphenylpyruvate dioxygenase [Saccharopolyspora indica]
MSSNESVFHGMLVDHIRFYVDDIPAQLATLVDGYGLQVYARSNPAVEDQQELSVAVGHGDIRLLLTEPLVGDHPGAAYVGAHGDGVADIALRVLDTEAAFAEAVRRGAEVVSEPFRFPDGMVTASIRAFGDTVHTFVQRPVEQDVRTHRGLVATGGRPSSSGLAEVDHFAVVVPPGELDALVAFYRDVLAFEQIFSEEISVGAQAMNTKVVQSGSGAVTFTLIEPIPSETPGHVEEFLVQHGGPGVQHIAFSTSDIVRTVRELTEGGVSFMATPDSYYDVLPERIDVARHRIAELRKLAVLVDEDHDGQLFQIFASSVHPRKTIFFEIIERLGARSFGTGNIRALYRAAEQQRSQEVTATV